MKTNTSFSKITIDSGNAKRERFPLTHSVNTTASFGETQPACVRLLVPNSKTVGGCDSLIRLAPMVAPTFGDMRLKVWHHFVGMSDLLRSFSKFMAQQPYGVVDGVRKQEVLPRLPLRVLSCLALFGCRVTVYKLNSNTGHYILPKYDDNDATVLNNFFHTKNWFAHIAYEDSRFPGYSGCMVSPSFFDDNLPTNLIPCGNHITNDSSTVLDAFDYSANVERMEEFGDEIVPLDKADLVFNRRITTVGVDIGEIAVAVRLSAFGKRIRKILLACGYQLNFTSATPVRIMEIMAYYKAYFDTFGLCLYQNYESTNANILLQSFDMGNNLFDLGNATFCKFVTDLGNCFVTDEQDFISAHQKTDAVSSRQMGFVNNIVLAPNYAGQNLVPALNQDSTSGVEYDQVRAVTDHVFINQVNHTEVDAELLKRLYKVTNRNTIAGRRIAELLRAAGYGKYVDEQKSNFIGYTEVRINVSDINATADSTNSVGESALGEYVGKGVGYDEKENNKTFTFENNEFGYWVTMFAIVPNSGYCQGIDPLLYDVDKFDLYDRELDGLGMEYSRKTVVVGSEDWHEISDLGDNATRFDESFGLVPRFSRYKVAHNICNGDFSLRSTRDGYLPFMLDKFIAVNDKFAERLADTSDGNRCYAVEDMADVSNLPLAGNAWRYNNRYPWLNNFERIFASFLRSSNYQDAATFFAKLETYEFTYNQYDSFIIQSIIPMTTYAPMLPVADSYGTTDENDGNGDMTMGKA